MNTTTDAGTEVRTRALDDSHEGSPVTRLVELRATVLGGRGPGASTEEVTEHTRDRSWLGAVPAPVESALPERSLRRVSALDPANGAVWPANLPRPARLLHPEKVEAVAELPDRPPRLFIWRNIRHRVAKADGPERIHGEWWVSEQETHLVRDYYRVETADGSRYWLFRDAPAEQGGGWWLHGVADA